MGWFGAALGVLSAIWILMFRWRRLQWRESSMAIGLIVVVFIAAGEFSPLAPANWLRTLPGFSNFRIPSRFILLVPLAASLCVAFAARAWQDRPWKPRARLSAEILCIAGVCQLLIVNREAYRDVFIIAPTEVEARVLNVGMPTIAEREPPSAALSRLGENSNLIRSMAEGVSPLNCYEQLMVRRAARPGPAGLNGGADVTISDQMFSPGEVEASVQVTRGGRGYVSLNQNFVAGWSTTFGAAERDPDSGLPYVVAPTGYSGPVWFSFTPPGLPLGFLLLVVGLLVWRFVWKHSTPAVADGRMHADVPQTDGGRTRHTHVNPIGS
jgi:hypothetical protein